MPSRSLEGAEEVKFWEVVFWILEVRSCIWRVEKEEFYGGAISFERS